MTIFRTFGRCRKASVATVFALVLPILLGFAALIAEFGSILVTEARNQRVADLASYAGALAYNAATSDKETKARSAAKNVASLNGVPAAGVTVTFPTGIKTAGATAVRAEVTTPYTLALARVLTSKASVPVSTDAFTEISGGASSCILALNPGGTGVTMTGGTSLSAASCAVNSNSTVSATCGTSITASAVTYGSTLTEGCSNITANTKVRQTTNDPFLGNTGVASLWSNVATIENMAGPVAPTVPAGTVDLTTVNSSDPTNYLGYSSYTTKNFSNGCTATQNAAYTNDWTITCPDGGTYNFKGISGGSKLKFNKDGAGNSTYNFSDPVSLSGTSEFGKGTYNFAQGINVGGGATVVFDRGTFRMGQSSNGCWSARFSICHTGTSLTFRGPSTFELSAGIAVQGGTTTKIGYDSAGNNVSGNSYWFGPSSGGDAILTGGGANLWFADATAGGKVFKISGNVNAGGGGTCTVLPAAAQHDINGNVRLSGAIYLGSGVYTVDGYMVFGAGNSGGSVSCNGEVISVKGINVNIVLSGAATNPDGGDCNGKVFCSIAGYDNVVLKAPTTGDLANLLVIGPQNAARTGSSFFGQGSSGGTLSGAFYFPYGSMTMAGGSGVSDAGECFQLVATQISITQGATAASSCVGGSGSVSAKLVR